MQQQEEEGGEEEDANQSDTMRSQDIENLNRQLIELEKQMDLAKRH